MTYDLAMIGLFLCMKNTFYYLPNFYSKFRLLMVRLFLTEGTPYGTLKTIIGVSIPWRKKTNLRLLEIDIEVTYFG